MEESFEITKFGEWRRMGGNFTSGIVCPENGDTGKYGILTGRNLRMLHTILYENWMQEPEVSQNVVGYILD